MNTNHVDGEIWVPDDEPTPRMREEMQQATEARVPDGVTIKAAEPTDLDYRAAALNAAISFADLGKARTDWTLDVAANFEKYLRGEAA